MKKFLAGMLVGVFGMVAILAIVIHFSMISFLVYSFDLSNLLVTGHFGEMHKSLNGSKSKLSPAELKERIEWSLSKDREYALDAIKNGNYGTSCTL